MNILLVVDGSSYSETAARILGALHLSGKTRVTVMTVVPEPTFLGGVTLDLIRGTSRARRKAREEQQQKATELLQRTVQNLGEGTFKVETLVHWGNPAEMILWAAEERSASLIIMGAKGLGNHPSFHLGSVALKVMKYANASVLLAKEAAITQTRTATPRRAGLSRIILATDGSRYSEATNRFLLDLPLPRPCEVIVITALQSHLSAWVKTPTLDFQTNQELLAQLQTSEENEARKITDRVEKQFQAKGRKAVSVVMRGGAAECILAAAREYKPDIIALGSRGLTGIKSLLLGSVAERVTRYANCSVLIGRDPTSKV